MLPTGMLAAGADPGTGVGHAGTEGGSANAGRGKQEAGRSEAQGDSSVVYEPPRAKTLAPVGSMAGTRILEQPQLVSQIMATAISVCRLGFVAGIVALVRGSSLHGARVQHEWIS